MEFIASLAIASLVVGFLGLIVGVFAAVQVLALKNSTHKITYLDPTKQIFDTLTDEQKEALAKSPYDNIS